MKPHQFSTPIKVRITILFPFYQDMVSCGNNPKKLLFVFVRTVFVLLGFNAKTQLWPGYHGRSLRPALTPLPLNRCSAWRLPGPVCAPRLWWGAASAILWVSLLWPAPAAAPTWVGAMLMDPHRLKSNPLFRGRLACGVWMLVLSRCSGT